MLLPMNAGYKKKKNEIKIVSRKKPLTFTKHSEFHVSDIFG